jgi:hypothetical protein
VVDTVSETSEDDQREDLAKVDDVIEEAHPQPPHQSSKNDNSEDEEIKVEDPKPDLEKSLSSPGSPERASEVPEVDLGLHGCR